MRIACIAPDDLSLIIFCRTMSELLAERGHELVTIGRRATHAEELRSLKGRHIDVPMERYLSPVEDLRYLARLTRVLRAERPDVLITFTTKPNTLGWIAARLAGVGSTVVAVRGLGQLYTAEATGRERLARRVVTWLYRAAFKSAELVWFTNPDDAEQLVREAGCPPGKILLTGNALDLSLYRRESLSEVDIEAVRSEVGADGPIVVMVARLLWTKGVREFVEAAVALHGPRPDITFVLVAPPEHGSAQAVPESWVREAEGRARFRWLGFRKDVREIYAASDLAVLPSYYKEGGSPRALIEPMALGVPVIAADTPECRGPVRPGVDGLLVPPRDAAALAGAVEAMLADPDQLAQRGRAARQRVEDAYDDRRVLDTLLARMGL